VDRQRKIIHMDMDAFYAAVEQRDFPAYRGRPVVVGGAPDGRGVVATCSYEARRFGIHSAMPCARAARLRPDAIFLRPRFQAYQEVSRQIQGIFRQYTERVEPLSLDEAYLDVSGVARLHGSATFLAREIKRRIREETALTASAGVSYNKFLAKLASDMDKPDGLYLITPEQGPGFAAELPIGRFHGVGPATERRMRAHGIHTGRDLLAWSLPRLQAAFGKSASYYYHAARGIDERPVSSQRVRHSLGAETTFQKDLDDPAEMLQQLERLAAQVAEGLAARRLGAHTLTIKVKYADFKLVTRSATTALPLWQLGELRRYLGALLARTEAGARPVRLLGVIASGLVAAETVHRAPQLELFPADPP
jgi:DNA polymerase-4